MLKDIIKGDDKRHESIKDFGVALTLSGIIVLAAFITIMFIFFYGSPLLLIWSLLLILLKIRICDSGIEVSLENIIKKRLKIYMVFE